MVEVTAFALHVWEAWEDERPSPPAPPQASFAKTYCERISDLHLVLSLLHLCQPCLLPSSLERSRQLSNLGITGQKGAKGSK